MKPRPRISIPLTGLDWLLEISAWLLLGVFLSVVAVSYSSLPEHIPVHFNAWGAADAQGNKEQLLYLVATGTVLFVLLGVMVRFPHRFNYLVTITETNAERQYFLAIRLIRILKLLIMTDFVIIWLTMMGLVKDLGIYFLPVTLLALVTTIIGYLHFSLKARH